ncbi:hypothetical protein N8940_01770 [Sphingomonadaceae bacterium]|nr:hypothetical protein [Sphingomonadaceae bacterium]
MKREDFSKRQKLVSQDEIRIRSVNQTTGSTSQQYSATELAEELGKARSATKAIFQNCDVSDGPAWDMLLTLFVSDMAAKGLTSAEIAAAQGCTASTGLRWLQHLEHAGLTEFFDDSSGQHENLVRLTVLGKQKMEAALECYLFRADESAD